MSFSPANRLSKKDFKKAGRKKSVNGSFVRILYKENGLTESRFSVLISSKVIAKATRRNRVRRVIKEAIRGDLPRITPGYDVIISVLRDSSRGEKNIISDVDKSFKNVGLI